MEELRRKLSENVNLYPTFVVRPATADQKSRSLSSAISINSTSSTTSSKSDTKPAVPPRKIARAIVISSDEEDNHPEMKEPSVEVKGPSFPVPRPYKPPQADRAPAVPVNLPYAKPGIPIQAPSIRNMFPLTHTLAPTDSGVDQEEVALPNLDHVYEYQTSSAEAEKALREMIEQTVMDSPQDIDMEDAVVQGFSPSIRLLPHQVMGRHWMKQREIGKARGGILADDMGLGKTIQALVRIVDGRPKKEDKAAGISPTTLIVCPVALIGQWAEEIKKMAPALTVIEHHGANRTSDPAKLKSVHVVVTSYTIVSSEHASWTSRATDESAGSKSKTLPKLKPRGSSSDSDDSDAVLAKIVAKGRPNTTAKKSKQVKDALFGVHWFRIILDEAHNIKNRLTKTAKACFDLKSKYRWCLTGTPMQNGVDELYSLIRFLGIRPLNEWDVFNTQIAKPIKSGKQVRAMKKLHVVLKAIMLRRRKDDKINGKSLIDLPNRVINIVKCTFSVEEETFYKSLEDKMGAEVDKLEREAAVQKSYVTILVMLLRLRQACNHPSLVTGDYHCDEDALAPKPGNKEGTQPTDDLDDLAATFGQLGIAKRLCQVCQATLALNVSGVHCSDCAVLVLKAAKTSKLTSSAKTRKIMELLANISERPDKGEKTIIFSQFTSMLNLIEPFLREKGMPFARYDGTMSKDAREAALSKIKDSKDITVILISFKAGSTGLNLTVCNNVILVDLWWNPALEEQAFDRAHRFGQEREVNIYKLTIENTVEDRILDLQEKKRELTRAALSGDKVENNKLSVRDLLALFRHGGRDDDDY